MTRALRGRRIGFVERPHPPGHRGSVTYRLIPLLRERGARVEIVHAERGLHRLDVAPPWDLVVLKSGSAAALHLAAAAEGWGIPSVNRSEATRLAQDKLASTAVLQGAGLPVASARLAWLGPGAVRPEALTWQAARLDGRPDPPHRSPEEPHSFRERLDILSDRPLIVKAARGSRGVGLWAVETGELPALAEEVSAGPYLLMEQIPHASDDLKVFVAGGWVAAVERPFPATTLEAKLGHPVPVPGDAAEVAWKVGRLLGLTCFGCDFVEGPDGWTLVDVNAFPGYKGATEAPVALVAAISRAAEEGV